MLKENEIKTFYTIIDTKIQLTKESIKYYGKETAPNFCSLDFWDINENMVSRILAFFLNPSESHDQRDVYLNHFLQKFNLSYPEYNSSDKVSVECEHFFKGGNKNRFIDIVIKLNNGKKVIGIENKIYNNSDDQKNQLIDYANYLNEKFIGDYCLIYLAPKYKLPSTASISELERNKLEEDNKLKLINYEDHLIECIAEFSRLTENIRVQSFLKDFEKTLKRWYMGEENLSTSKMLSDYIQEDVKHLEISFAIQNSMQRVKQNLKEKFKLQIQEVAAKLDLEINDLALTPKNWRNHYVSINYESNGILCGIKRNIKGAEKIGLPEEMEIFLSKSIKHNFKTSHWFPFYYFLYDNIENNKSFWLAIETREVQSEIHRFVKLLVENYNNDYDW